MAHSENFHVKRIVDSCAALSNDHNVPFVLCMLRKKKPEIHGTKNLKEHIVSLLTADSTLKNKMREDLADLMKVDDPEGGDSAVSNFEDAFTNKTPPPLPRRWDLIKQNQARAYLVTCIMVSYHRGGGRKPKISYFAKSGEEFKPQWWLDTHFPWVTYSNASQKIVYPGPGTFLQFLKTSIEQFFIHHGWDITTWPFNKLTGKELVNVQRSRGVRGEIKNLIFGSDRSSRYHNVCLSLLDKVVTESIQRAIRALKSESYSVGALNTVSCSF